MITVPPGQTVVGLKLLIVGASPEICNFISGLAVIPIAYPFPAIKVEEWKRNNIRRPEIIFVIRKETLAEDGIDLVRKKEKYAEDLTDQVAELEKGLLIGFKVVEI